MSFKRATAARVSIQDLQDGELVANEQGNVVAVETFLGQISRVNIIATVVDRFEATQERLDDQGKGFATVTLDDGTGVIRVKMWGELSAKLSQLQVGDLVLVVGRVRSFQGETYINGEIIRRLENPNWETVRLLELSLSRREPHRLEDQFSSVVPEFVSEQEEESTSSVREIEPGVWHNATATLDQSIEKPDELVPSPEVRRLVIETIKKYDAEGGARFDQILEATPGVTEEVVEQVLIDLLSEGEVYEPEIHRYKKS
ncbi:MAG: OB-fold nucleic acid binding domain-containing protein [Candidatus Hermodarchaeota archaeon]|nr:OB-fold nucleic acid binding domain-containing protein [Candidatus Hermodarchaeota archaeon]